MTLDLTIDQLLTTTRSVRKRLDLSRPVDPALIRECLEIAIQGPTGSNQQGWQWLVVTGEAQRGAIAELYQRSWARYRGAGGQTYDDPERAAVQKRVVDSAQYLADHLAEVPVLVIPCIRLPGGLPAGTQASPWASIMPATWSYMLAARSRGLGTCWTTLHIAYEKEAASILGLPDDVHQAAMIPTAHTIGTDFKPAARRPLDEVLHWDRW